MQFFNFDVLSENDIELYNYYGCIYSHVSRVLKAN